MPRPPDGGLGRVKFSLVIDILSDNLFHVIIPTDNLFFNEQDNRIKTFKT